MATIVLSVFLAPFPFFRLGFPYSAAVNSVAPHRSLVVHTSREFFNKVTLIVSCGQSIGDSLRSSLGAPIGAFKGVYERQTRALELV